MTTEVHQRGHSTAAPPELVSTACERDMCKCFYYCYHICSGLICAISNNCEMRDCKTSLD